MGAFLGNPALRLLFRLKFQGGLRRQVRRLRQPKHWVFLILGGLAASLWVFSLIFNAVSGTTQHSTRAEMLVGSQVGLCVLFVLTVLGAFGYRGLYLPKEEIEFAFSAPITRGDLVRYRLFVSLMKSLFAGVLFGVVAAVNSGNGFFAFAGALVAMLTIPLVGQGTALLLGGVESRVGRLAKHFPVAVVARVGIVVFVILLIVFANGSFGPLFEDFGASTGGKRLTLAGIAAHPVVAALLLPFKPWACLIAARSLSEFLPWALFALGVWFLLFESVARIRVDYRELSLATSSDIAKRISRMRKGNVDPTRGSVTRATIGWRVPWLFGRGPFGAVAWNKTTAIVRKSRGTLILSALIIAFLTILGTVVTRGREVEGDEKLLLVGSILIAGVGTLYMCAGLRFDFRADLELMDRIKTWPLAPWRLFLATILPEVLLVSGMLFLAVLGRALWIGTYHPAVVGVLAFQPLGTLTWVALDNAVFLFSPIRYTPGEEGALHNMGRSMLLMILRGVLLGVVGAVVVLPAILLYTILEDSVTTAEAAAWIAGSLAWFALLLVDLALVFLGGKMLSRFDVARDKPV